MPLNDTFWALLVALGLGLLTGLQKERAGPLLAGLRTFALITPLFRISKLSWSSK